MIQARDTGDAGYKDAWRKASKEIERLWEKIDAAAALLSSAHSWLSIGSDDDNIDVVEAREMVEEIIKALSD